tara:strand:+ start:1606 stop:1782 length:177 start_codon:yes stop_codon:yes gene_type:complete
MNTVEFILSSHPEPFRFDDFDFVKLGELRNGDWYWDEQAVLNASPEVLTRVERMLKRD